jgi:hypothetical protein
MKNITLLFCLTLNTVALALYEQLDYTIDYEIDHPAPCIDPALLNDQVPKIPLTSSTIQKARKRKYQDPITGRKETAALLVKKMDALDQEKLARQTKLDIKTIELAFIFARRNPSVKHFPDNKKSILLLKERLLKARERNMLTKRESRARERELKKK